MPAIADMVASLEHDHSDALAKIDSLNATNAALTDALNAITAEKAALEARVAELGMRNDGMIAMAEKVASSALDMLNAARLPAGTPAEVIPFAPKLKTVSAASVAPSLDLADVLEEMLKPEPAPQAAAAKDSAGKGTDRDAPDAFSSPSITVRRPLHIDPDDGGLPMFLRRGINFDVRARISGASPIPEPASAVDRMKRLLPALTIMRRQGATPPRVDPDDGGLPMFWRRDTVFARAAARG